MNMYELFMFVQMWFQTAKKNTYDFYIIVVVGDLIYDCCFMLFVCVCVSFNDCAVFVYVFLCFYICVNGYILKRTWIKTHCELKKMIKQTNNN